MRCLWLCLCASFTFSSGSTNLLVAAESKFKIEKKESEAAQKARQLSIELPGGSVACSWCWKR